MNQALRLGVADFGLVSSLASFGSSLSVVGVAASLPPGSFSSRRFVAGAVGRVRRSSSSSSLPRFGFGDETRDLHISWIESALRRTVPRLSFGSSFVDFLLDFSGSDDE